MGAFFSFYKQHKILFLGLATSGIFLSAGFVYYRNQQNPYIKKDQECQGPLNTSNTRYDNQNKNNKKTMFIDLEKDTMQTRFTAAMNAFESISNLIQVNYIPNTNCLEPQTIVDILQYTIDVAGDEYIRITLVNRKQRRTYKSNSQLNLYKQQILKYNEDIEELLEKSQAELLQRLGVTKEIFEESMLVLMERGFFQQLYMLQASVKQKIKEKILSNKDLSVQQVKEIIRYNIKILKQQPEPFQYIVNQMMNKNELKEYIPNAINMIVQDFTYQKFKVEEEDQIKNLQKPECMGDSEIHQLLGEIETTMAEVMNQLGLGGIDSIPENFENFT
ncbi:unnamed protein product (macronuclear) [Paramecium tetraurelia]|uniref:Transmembrane protein n=1 Tax=Paramecium tetraurelia TaxID=5888 RepID=A0CI67_PARTE|nr:uncharacterized protein GSPATT00007619001 [Paramecium tetraurelia]CAK70484.1 unnamed protein product [Paramecium tetraurelia]|eukprot:XP_001437881.1 hypothetical protein (macronuclear) [Paramecium tetraurelia strain d4-2]